MSSSSTDERIHAGSETESRHPESSSVPGGSDERPAVSRRSVLRMGSTAFGGLALGVLGFSRPSSAGQSLIPTTPTYYGVRMVGQSPNETFDREGLLLVTPPVDTTGATQINARDVALRSGSPPSLPEAGAIWYVTNTALYNSVDIPATPPLTEARLDVAVVEADEAAGVLLIQPDANLARAAQLNVFTARTSLVASIFNVISGFIQIQFPGGDEITGALDLVGVAPTGAASDQSRLVAEFTGVAVATG